MTKCDIFNEIVTVCKVIGGVLIRKELTNTKPCEDVLGEELQTSSNMVYREDCNPMQLSRSTLPRSYHPALSFRSGGIFPGVSSHPVICSFNCQPRHKGDCGHVVTVEPCWEEDQEQWDKEGGGGNAHSDRTYCDTRSLSEHSHSRIGEEIIYLDFGDTACEVTQAVESSGAAEWVTKAASTVTIEVCDLWIHAT